MTGTGNDRSDRVGRAALSPALLIAGVIAVAFIALEVTRRPHAPFYDDFHYYWEAGRRFLADPATLYLETSRVDLRGFLYPPPAILLFLPLSLLPKTIALGLFRAIAVAALLASVVLLVRLFETDGLVVRPRDRVLLVLIALGAGPSYTNTLYGQVNTLVLLDCVAFRLLLDRRRPFLAGAVVALGVWLKVYPLFCLLWVIVWERRFHDVRRLLLGFVAAVVLVPVLCLPLVPASLYRVYFSEILPVTGGKTFQNILNQSLLGALARLDGPKGYYLDWEHCHLPIVPPLWARVVNAGFALGSVAALGPWARSTSVTRRLVAYCCLLSLIPIVSPLGWAYVYVMALPALFVALLQCAPGGRLRGVLLVGACLGYFVPATHVLGFAAHLPTVFFHALYDRYAVSAGLVCALLLLPARPPPALLGDAHHREGPSRHSF